MAGKRTETGGGSLGKCAVICSLTVSLMVMVVSVGDVNDLLPSVSINGGQDRGLFYLYTGSEYGGREGRGVARYPNGPLI